MKRLTVGLVLLAFAASAQKPRAWDDAKLKTFEEDGGVKKRYE
jgi:hypothetical protein